jgi:hypothetical protein
LGYELLRQRRKDKRARENARKSQLSETMLQHIASVVFFSPRNKKKQWIFFLKLYVVHHLVSLFADKDEIQKSTILCLLP